MVPPSTEHRDYWPERCPIHRERLDESRMDVGWNHHRLKRHAGELRADILDLRVAQQNWNCNFRLPVDVLRTRLHRFDDDAPLKLSHGAHDDDDRPAKWSFRVYGFALRQELNA